MAPIQRAACPSVPARPWPSSGIPASKSPNTIPTRRRVRASTPLTPIAYRDGRGEVGQAQGPRDQRERQHRAPPYETGAGIIVGQNVLAAADKRSEATYNDADAVLHEAVKIQEHLAAQDTVLGALIDKAQGLPG